MSLALLTLCVRPAQAQNYPGGGSGGGSWQVMHTANGVDKFDMFDPQGHHYHDEQPWSKDITGYGQQIFVSPGYQISKEGKGTIVYQFDYLDHWGSSLTPPFDHTWVKKTANALWGVTTNADGTMESSGFASDGLGDPAVDGVSQGTHYEKKDIGGGSFSVSVDLRSSVAGSSPAGNGVSGSGGEGGSLSVWDVGLPLISSDIENSTKKGGAPNMRARDGSMSVDSVAVYDSITGVWRGDTTLTASSPFDDALFTWSADGGSPSPYDLSNNLGIPSRFLSSISLDMGLCPTSQGLPMTTSVGVTVASQTDASASDKASYTIKWHAPYEAYAPGISQGGKDFFKERFSGVAPGGSGNEEASDAGKMETEVFVDAAMLGFALTGPEEIVGLVEVICHICHITQFELDYLSEPEVIQGATSGDGTWGVAVGDHNVPADLANNPLGWHYCNMSWWRVAYWEADHYECDKYGHNGWISGGNDCYAKQYTRVSEEPVFEHNGS